MKLAILTLPLHVNYGGLLQAYSLQKVLENKGHSVFIIDYPYRERLSDVIIYLEGRILYLSFRKNPINVNLKLYPEIRIVLSESILKPQRNYQKLKISAGY